MTSSREVQKYNQERIHQQEVEHSNKFQDTENYRL